MRVSVVDRAESFAADLRSLWSKYSDVEKEVQELETFLQLGYVQPEISIESFPNVYAIKHDYRPMGAAGRSRFLVTYHATDPTPSPSTPYRTFTLLTITEK